MDKSEFLSLPERQRAEVLADMFADQLAGMKMPQKVLPPKYDAKLSRKGGQFCWMSEMDLDSLEYWLKMKRESAGKGGQYAEKDQKTADTLTRWVKWRQIYPTDRWFGERNDTKTTALPPSREPKLHDWSNSGRSGGGGQQSKPADDGYGDAPSGGAGGYSESDYGGDAGSDDLPF